jgi:hypothetical protein
MMITDEECGKWLEQEDGASRPVRLSRLALIVNEYGPPRHLLIPGGFVPAQAFEEARWCYVNGQFIGCVLLCQVVLEHILAGQFSLMGKDKTAKSGFGNLCAEAEKERFISAEERDLFDSLRVKRNPYVHPRGMDRADRIERRMMVEDSELDEILTKRLSRSYIKFPQNTPFTLTCSPKTDPFTMRVLHDKEIAIL